MTAMQKLPDDHPMMKAWNEYLLSDEAKNSRRWAQRINLEQDTSGDVATLTHPHLDGSLWAAFSAGFAAASKEQQ